MLLRDIVLLAGLNLFLPRAREQRKESAGCPTENQFLISNFLWTSRRMTFPLFLAEAVQLLKSKIVGLAIRLGTRKGPLDTSPLFISNNECETVSEVPFLFLFQLPFCFKLKREGWNKERRGSPMDGGPNSFYFYLAVHYPSLGASSLLGILSTIFTSGMKSKIVGCPRGDPRRNLPPLTSHFLKEGHRKN